MPRAPAPTGPLIVSASAKPKNLNNNDSNNNNNENNSNNSSLLLLTKSMQVMQRSQSCEVTRERLPTRFPPSLFSLSRTPQDYSDNNNNNGFCGILYKWTKFGCGWRPRWFMLHDGVLTFFKLHGPNKFNFDFHSKPMYQSKIIGRKSFHYISNSLHSPQLQSSHPICPAGKIYLKMACVKERKSDEKRFTIYTDIESLRLKADTRDDKFVWVAALRSVKDSSPSLSPTLGGSQCSTNYNVHHHDDGDYEEEEDDDDAVVSLSTEKLRRRLEAEGVSEEVIKDSESIMRRELLAMQSNNNHSKINNSTHSEAGNSNSDDAIINRSKSQFEMQHELHKFGPSDSDNESAIYEAAMGDKGNDNLDLLSMSSFKSIYSQFQCSSSSDSDDEEGNESDDTDTCAGPVMLHYPHIKRRKKLPDPVEEEKKVSLWSLIKDNIGKDLNKVCLPVYFNEPISSLQKSFEDMEYSYLIDRAYEWGKRGSNLMRILNVAAFAVSGYSSSDGRTCKPFNPLLGETYEAVYPDKGLRFISEKVSNHPMVIAYHCEGRGWKCWGDCNIKSRFWGRSIQIDPVGVLTLEFDGGEVYRWSKVSTSINNLIIGKINSDHYGTMHISGNGDYSCKLKFKEQSVITKNPHQVEGIVFDKHGKIVASLFGKWDQSLHYISGCYTGNDNATESTSKARILWKRSKPTKYPTRYNLPPFAITLNELTPGLKEKLPPTDSRLRPDLRYYENGQYEKANLEKQRLEKRQRQSKMIQERGWEPAWFTKDRESGTYVYTGHYWEAREKGDWKSSTDIFSDVPCEGSYNKNSSG